MAQNSQVNVGIKFRSDTKEIENSLNKLKKSLQDLQSVKPMNFKGTRDELEDLKKDLKEVEQALSIAFNPKLNTVNLNSFYQKLNESGISVNKLSQDMAKMGPQGNAAFNRLASQVLNTNLKLRQTHSLLDSMGKTMVNTVKWGIASSVMNTFTQSVQGAFQYVQSLEKSLTNIRIVTGDSTEKMAQFADQANKSAQALGRSTLDYTKASLTFYQQGLNDQDVQARTEATLKAQNITGAGQQMADYLTSVWNGYKVANEEAEVYVDKLAAVADSSASDMSQLAIAMSKVASTANTMGVDVDQLNAQIATVVATTRQAPESVGTAFKTIYTRMNDIKTGSDEAEISLGRYSGKMAELGFNVLDATGHLRDTGQVMEEIGGRWQDLTREQQIYLAQTMGGQRQVNQLMALFDNWTTYSELLNTSLESEGTLAEKNARYMESLGAKMEQLGAAGERVKAALINENEIKGVVDVLTQATNLLGIFIEGLGGGSNALLTLGSIATSVFSDTIAKEINNIIINFQNADDRLKKLQQQKTNTQKWVSEISPQLSSEAQSKVVGDILKDKQEIESLYKVMSNQEINTYNALLKEKAEHNIIKAELEEKKKISDDILNGIQKQTKALKDQLQSQGQLSEESKNFLKNFGNSDELQASLGELKSKVEETFQAISSIRINPDAPIKESITQLKKPLDQFLNSQGQMGEILKNTTGYTQLQNQLSQTGITADTAKQAILGFLNSSADGIENLDTQKYRELTTEIDRQAAKYREAENARKEYVQGIKQLSQVKVFVQMAAGIGQVASGVRTLLNLQKTWKDDSISTGEKIIQTLTSGTMALAQLYTGFQKTAEGATLLTTKWLTAANEGTLATFSGIVAQEGLTAAFIQTGKAAWESLGPYLPLALAVAAAVGLIVAAYKEWNKEADAAKKANEIAADAKKTYDDLKTSLQNVKSALEDLHNAEDNLDGLTKGTQEWRDALQQCNDKVLELISNYPELAQYVTNQNGQLKLNAEGEQAYLNQLQAGVQNARNASYIASSNSREADVRAAAADIGHNSFYTDQNNAQAGRQYANAEQVKTVVQAIDKVIGEGADLTGGLSELTDKIADQTGQNKELVSAILSNEDAVLQLRTQLQQNETADKLMYETMAQGVLANNSTFKSMDELGQQVASAMGGATLEKRIGNIQKDLIADMSGLNMSRFTSGSDNTVQYILNRLNEAQGTNWRMDSNAVRGGEGNRTLAFLDQTGKLHTYTRQQIASTIAAKEALENLGASAEKASEMLVNIDTKVSSNAQNAVKQWIAGQDATDINRSGLENLQNQYKDLEKLFSQDELKSIAEARGIDTQNNRKWQEQLEKDWDNSLQYLSSSFDNVAQEASNSVKQAWSSIDEDDDITKSTLSTQKAIVENMQKAFAQGGKKGLEDITNFFSKTEDLDKLNSLDFDFTKGSVEDFKDALEEAGIQTRANTDQLQAYINAKKEESEIISSEQNYKSVHSITDKLKEGDIIDEEQADILRQAGININNYFTKMADGSLKLIQDAQKFQYHVNQISLQPLEQEWNSLRDRLNKAGEFEQGEYSASNPNMRWEDFSKTAASSQTYEGAEVATEQNRELLQAQIELLDIVGQKNDHIAEIQEKIHNNEAIGIEDYRKVSEALQNHQQDWEGLSKKQQEYFSRMQQLSEEMANIRLIPVDEDVDTEALQNLTDYLYEEADALEGVDDGLTQNRQAAEEVAESILRYDSALEEVIDKYDEWTKMLSSDNIQDNIQAGEQLQNVYADLLDLPFENLSPDFTQSTENLELLKQAANGSEQAYRELQEAAAQDILAQVGLDDSQFYIDKDAIEQSLYQLTGQEWDDIEIGANLDTGDFLNQLTDMVNAAGMSAEQATDYLASMGVDAVVKENTATTEETQESIGYVPTRVLGEPLSQDITYLGSDGLPHEGHVNYQAAGYVYEPQPISETATKESKAFSLEVTSAHKKSGGGFKYQNASHGGGSKGGGGKKGGGGSGGKAKEPNKAKGATNKADRYRNNTVKANKLANQMTKLNKQRERLTGKDALKNLQKQLEILEKQKDVIRERLGLQRDEQNELANNLKKYGATFDKDGTLNNYFTTHDKILKEYNDKVAEWNQMTAEQQESNKDYLSNAKEIMDQAFKDLERYDKLQQEIAKTQQEQIDKTQEQIDLKVKQLDLKIKAELDLSKAKRDWNKFQKDIVNEIRDDDILGLNRFRFADIASYYNNAGTGSIQNLTDRLKEVMGDQNGIFSGSYFTQQLAKMSITDRAAQLEKVKEIFDDLQDQMEGFKEIADEIKESIFDAIDAAQDAFDEQMDEYEYLGDLIDHNMKITEMFFGDEAYDQMAKFYDRIEENNNAQLDFLAKQKDLWYSRMAEEQARMNQLAQTQGTDSNLYKEARDRFEEYKKHWMDTVKDLNSTVEDALDNIMDKYNNAINKILVNFELKLGDGHTLDDIEDEWDILNDQADRYFDKINAAYEIDKLENAFNDAINDNDGDIAAQQSLNDLMEQQLAYLRDKQRLTQYDVDRANALLQIEMKRLALEQSRSNKNRLRLRRDSQGNYTYQYTADTEAISKAEQELADAQNSLYNSDKAAYVDNLSDIQKSAENIKNKLEDIWTDENLSKEQKLQKSYELEKYYGDQINKLLEDNANIRNNLIQSSTEELAKIYGINIEQFQTLSDTEQTNILKDLIPQAGSYLSKMTEGLIGDGGIGKLFEDSINRFLQAEDERINSIAEIERNGQINFEDIINDTNTVIGQAEQLLDNNEALINSYEQELNAVQNTINGVNDLIQTYERAKQAAIQAATAANNFINQENVELIGSSLSREAAAQRANDNVLNSWVANGNSYGDLQNYTPYEPNWHSSDFAAIFGSSNVGLADLATYQEALQNTNSATGNIINQGGYTPINVNSILDTIQSNVSHINDILEALHTESSNYYTNALNKVKDIERAIIANQTVHIDADFPNARDVSNIIDAINNLTLVAAQKAGKI